VPDREVTMKLRARILSLSILVALAGTAAAGTVQVAFVGPENFTDLGTNKQEEDQNMVTIARHLQALGQRWLPADQTLKIEFTEVDLAGAVRPSRASIDPVRVITGDVDYPRMQLHYVLSGPGLERTGDDRLADLNFTHGLANRGDSTSLIYEKRMLTAWFKSRFVEGRPD
jgi:hypothetical protein